MRALFLCLLLLFAPEASARDLKLAAWNLSWLTLRPAGGPDLPEDVQPKRPEDIALLRGYALKLDADVVAFSEVDGPELAAEIFPPDRYSIHITGDRVVQRDGFAIRRGIAFSKNPDLVGLDLYRNARFHLRSGADITLDLPQGRLRLLAVHLKSGCRQGRLDDMSDPACRTLGGQLPVLQGWIAERTREAVPFVLLGDFNRWMEGNDRFFAGLETATPLARATQGHHSPCWGGGGFLDHIIAGGAARAWLRPESLRVMLYQQTGPAWKERLSDHCPTSAYFDLPD